MTRHDIISELRLLQAAVTSLLRRLEREEQDGECDAEGCECAPTGFTPAGAWCREHGG